MCCCALLFIIEFLALYTLISFRPFFPNLLVCFSTAVLHIFSLRPSIATQLHAVLCLCLIAPH